MIDIENKVYTALRQVLTPMGAITGSVFTESPAKFPYVFIEMTNNSIYERGVDSAYIENFSEQNFEINIYTKGNTKKTMAKQLAEAVDSKLKEFGFRRIMYSPVPNFIDNNIYRMILRYKVIVGRNETLYNV